MTRVIDTYRLWPLQARMLFHVLLSTWNIDGAQTTVSERIKAYREIEQSDNE